MRSNCCCLLLDSASSDPRRCSLRSDHAIVWSSYTLDLCPMTPTTGHRSTRSTGGLAAAAAGRGSSPRPGVIASRATRRAASSDTSASRMAHVDLGRPDGCIADLHALTRLSCEPQRPHVARNTAETGCSKTGAALDVASDVCRSRCSRAPSIHTSTLTSLRLQSHRPIRSVPPLPAGTAVLLALWPSILLQQEHSRRPRARRSAHVSQGQMRTRTQPDVETDLADVCQRRKNNESNREFEKFCVNFERLQRGHLLKLVNDVE
jgi:hypothetical protein